MKRITIISENFAEPWDEGIKKFAWSVGCALGREHEVQLLNVDRDGLSGGGGDAADQSPMGTGNRGGSLPLKVPGTRTFATHVLREKLKAFSPAIVLYVPSPSSTLGSFLRAYSLRRHAPRATHGMVALIPRRHGRAARPILRRIAPDVVFVPSYRSLLYLHRVSLRADITPVGVDTTVFRPPSSEERDSLRKKYDLRQSAYVYLHVGHLSEKRNLTSLIQLKSSSEIEVIVVGSTSTPEDESLRRRLESAGVRVVRRRVPIEEYYRLCDCYVFPVEDYEGCVEIPLSVFEALASGRPVLSKPFGGLRDFLQPGRDLAYFESDEELLEAAAGLRAGGAAPVRSMEEFSWEKVAARILKTLDQ
ncbi:MAG: glycosyltransferase family 4 protein [Candidatus Krumholzibacteria bacterium]|nr:glycosyltransferase family 4 protein [Candidatus Krumholzibacteria bacterium]